MSTLKTPLRQTVIGDIGEQWETHRLNWKFCTRCPLHETRNKVCLFRGTLPCQLLFIGEAPGESEDVLGVPFIGPAGHLLDEVYEEACLQAGDVWPVTAYGNILGCIPLDEGVVSFTGVRPPSAKEAKVCKPRLVELIELGSPRVIVYLGKASAKLKPETSGIFIFECIHPAAILRMEGRQGESQRLLAIKRLRMQLTTAVKMAMGI